MFEGQKIEAAVTEETVLFKTHDGAELVGTLYRPQHRPFAAIVLSPATGVLQGYYSHFARWLAAERGMACLTYDYRGMGRSQVGSMRRSLADMIDWGTSDQRAARNAIARLCPDTPIWILGHSLGAMLLPNQREFEGVARVIGVAAGFNHFTDHPWPYRAIAMMFWFGIGPVATWLMGYMPGRALRFGEDLPPRAYWQWRRWCTSSTFYNRDLGRRLPSPEWDQDIPFRLISFADDDLVPTQGTKRLAKVIGDKANLTVIDPKAEGAPPVGHIGVFARRNAAFWPKLLEG